jgi:hypothetical protein
MGLHLFTHRLQGQRQARQYINTCPQFVLADELTYTCSCNACPSVALLAGTVSPSGGRGKVGTVCIDVTGVWAAAIDLCTR